MSTLRRVVVATTSTAALAVGGLVAVAPLARAVDTTSPVVISEVYGGGGNSGAPYTNDFVELYNTSSTAVPVEGWSVQYGSSTGSTFSGRTTLTGSVPAHGYYLVQEGGGASGTALPTPDAVGTIAMSSASGKIALVSDSTTLTCGTTCATAAGVVDLVGFGSANEAAGFPTPLLSNTLSAQRKIAPFANTGDNSADFTVDGPTPKAAPAGGSGGTDCTTTPLPDACVPGADSIQDVQGDGFVSPMRGQPVAKLPGVVTAVSGASPRGFWIQDPTPDTARPTASSGLFVYTSSYSPSVGDEVLVTGSVSDYYTLASGETLTTTASLSLTELTSVTTVTTLSVGHPVPAAVAVDGSAVPDLYAPTTAGANVEDISSVNPSRSALEFYEAHEGMLISVTDAPVVGPGKAQYGEVYVTTKPDQKRTPRGGTYLPSYAGQPSGRLLVSPLTGSVPPANVGDLLTGTVVGPVDWSPYGGYDLRATTTPTAQDNGLKPGVAAAPAADQMTVGTYNVQNLSPADPRSKFDRLATGVVTNLRSPDVIAVEEIQDNSGPTDDGTVAADLTLTTLVDAITAAGGPSYSWTEIDPLDKQDGGQPGGNIRSVFLYNPERVGFTPRGTPSSTDAVTVVRGTDGTPTLSTNPGRVDPTNAAWTSSRKPLAAEFTFQGRKAIVVANHFNSKGGDQTADGRFQPPTRSSEIQRTKQAVVLNAFAKDVLNVDAAANLVLAGDFNDYQFSGPVTTLTDNGATLTDLIGTLPANERYTYVYDGISQVLDHIIVAKGLTDVEYDVVHLNSEFADQVSDHDPQVLRARLNEPTPAATPAVAVSPRRQNAGQYVRVRAVAFPAQDTLSVTLDGKGPSATIRTNRKGVGVTSFFLPVATARGQHAIVVTAPDGTSVSAPVRVLATCPTATGGSLLSRAVAAPVGVAPTEALTASGPAC
ncbi:MAG: lamin tail domain-containing protein [Actinomycetota bacterium]|nr:lamin tail domain-containing protein [Actinomycetota bacterium]